MARILPLCIRLPCSTAKCPAQFWVFPFTVLILYHIFCFLSIGILHKDEVYFLDSGGFPHALRILRARST